MECSLSTRNSRWIRGCEAADCLEPRVKKCHVIKSCHEMTPDIGHLGSVSIGASNNRSGAPQLMALNLSCIQSDVMADGLLG